jgi:hypothetical protein
MTNQKTTRDSFIFYRSFYETISDLNEKQQLQIYKAIAEFSLNDNLINLDGLSKTIFRLIEPQLLANKKRYLNGLKGAEHGLKGGRPKKQDNPEAVKIITPNKPLDNPEITPNITPNKNVNVNVNVNEECKLELINDNVNNNNNILIEKNITKKENHLENNFCKEVIDTLREHLQTTLNKKIITTNWQKQIELLLDKDLKPRGIEKAKQDIITCMQAVIDNHKEDYFPVIASASAFREKFSKIEDFLKRKNNFNNNFTNGMNARQKENWQAFHDFGNNEQTF